MSYSWIEALEEHISEQIRYHELDPRDAWNEILEMASANLDQLTQDPLS